MGGTFIGLIKVGNTLMVHMLAFSLVLILLFPGGAIAGTQQPSQSPDVQAVTQAALQQIADTHPNARVSAQILHVTIVENYAIAEWQRGETGGQQALVKRNGVWLVLGGGGGDIEAPQLVEYGIPERVATQLINDSRLHWQQQH